MILIAPILLARKSGFGIKRDTWTKFGLNVIRDLYHTEPISFSTDFFMPKNLWAPQIVWKFTRPVNNKTTIPPPPGLTLGMTGV